MENKALYHEVAIERENGLCLLIDKLLFRLPSCHTSPPECYNALSCIVRKPRKTTSKFHRIINAASVL